MANILLMPVGSHGDVHPFVAVGQALQARGHDVTLITSSYFESLGKKAGLPFVGIGTAADFQACLDHPDMWHPTRGFRAVAEWGVLPWMRTAYQLVAERYVPGKTVVVTSALGFGPRIAHEKLGVPLATIHLQPSMLLLTRFPEQVPSPLPEGVRHFEYVPFSQVFPRAAAVVHHGGIGTTAQALAAAVPQLVMHMAHDQPENAAHVLRLGVGRPISTKAFRGPTVAIALAELLHSPEAAKRCRAVAALFVGADPLGEACRAIEALIPKAHQIS